MHLLVITNVTIPDGTVDGESLKLPGLVESTMSTITVVLAEPTVDGDVVVAVTGGVDASTKKMPFMPADAWPGTVERYGYRPFFENLTRKVAECLGERSGVFFPAILKSCETLPLFLTVKITSPV
jgi:hypothetical protein